MPFLLISVHADYIFLRTSKDLILAFISFTQTLAHLCCLVWCLGLKIGDAYNLEKLSLSS